MDLDHAKAMRRLGRQLSRGRHEVARLTFLWPRNARTGYARLRELAEVGERRSILFLAGRMARHELRGGVP